MDGVLKSPLDQVVAKLIEGYDPDRIILFGSRAGAGSDEGSDYDLLVIKDTDERPADRRFQVERLFPDRSIGLDLVVYTPGEIRMLYSMGSPFVEQMIEGGRLLYMRKATAAWLAEARDDLESAAILLEHGRYRGVCLHSQQCVEKGLKVLLLEKGRRHPRTHDILELLNAARAEGWQLETDIDDAVFLNSVYRGRYPTEDGLLPLGEPQEKDAVKAHSAASGIMARIESFM